MSKNPKQSEVLPATDSELDSPPFDLPAAADEPHASGLSNSERALARTSQPYLDGLNMAQRTAVEAIDGPVLVLAGAGTGKTRVLTTRIAHILACNKAHGSQILAVTFTNKAAREMKERIGGLIGGTVAAMPWLGTFHSIGVKILRRHAELVGLKSGFTILDTDDQIRLLKQVIDAAGLDKDRWPARQLAGLIDSWKNRGLTPDKVPSGEAFGFASGKGADLYKAYQARLKDLNACDFGDLLLECLQLFLKHPDILKEFQSRFRYILVDEYQDTNIAQYLWLRLLAQGTTNICCVGDDDQSIYGWRGAEVDNILRFDKDFPGATVVRLERNYRSTAHILGAASGLIAKNQGRLGKTLFTEDNPGDKVTLLATWDDQEEARIIADDIEHLKGTGHAYNEMAILVRASAQMRAFEDRFVTLGLPYRVIGGPRFYERAEIKDAIAYLDVTSNPANDLKFERIINVPKRGIGATSVQRVRDLARAKGTTLTDAARIIVETEELTGKARRSLAGLMQSFERWRHAVDTLKHTEASELILDESGYTAMWQADKSPQAQTRLENLKELIRFMHDFDSLGGFLEHVALVMDAEQTNDGDRVSLMTLHAAKGLEFDSVFLPGWEEGLFPHQRALDEQGQEGLEEERRLAYVGITRARKAVKVSFAQNRRTHGLYQSAAPSRFVDELPGDHVNVEEASSPFSGAYRSFGSNPSNPFTASRFDNQSTAQASTYDTPGWQRAQRKSRAEPNENTGKSVHPRTKNQAPVTIEGELLASSTAPPSDFQVGDRVAHKKFGAGTVTSVDGNKLSIAFDHAGAKRVVDSFVSRAE
ncbi:MAG: UvrD-helicase domain-containing protein [Alphaproteobacteria bacterium]|nr:UvrD-helicase domain-containing protein [Alphaproteobacteria bacterium]